MTFEYLNRKFELMEAVDNLTSDHCEYYDMFILMELIVIDINDRGHEIYSYRFVNYFYGAMSCDKDEAIEIAKGFINAESEFVKTVETVWCQLSDDRKEEYYCDCGTIQFVEELAQIMGIKLTEQLIDNCIANLK